MDEVSEDILTHSDVQSSQAFHSHGSTSVDSGAIQQSDDAKILQGIGVMRSWKNWLLMSDLIIYFSCAMKYTTSSAVVTRDGVGAMESTWCMD